MAAGTCLKAKEPNNLAVIELDLCSDTSHATWDLINM